MTTETPEKIIKNGSLANYDRAMPGKVLLEYYDNSGFFNFGYWTPETKTQAEASRNLVAQLLNWIPDKTGKILDVACGMGATTRMLLESYPPEDVYAVNLSPVQVGLASQRAPGCGFAAMDATRLGFADESIDNIICVEAVFHFTTRADFLREAYRVLKPGGRLVHSDILHRPKRGVTQNFLPSPDALATVLKTAGFNEVEVLDRTRECVGGVIENLRVWPGQARKARRISLFEYFWALAFTFGFRKILKRRIRYYTLSVARKPLA